MSRKSRKTGNNLFHTLMELRGNPRACLFTEPMWGLSMNLCLPYMSVYMLAFGLNDVQVGIVSSVYMFSQMIFSFLAGAIVDKIGRRKSTVIFDFLAWSVPCLIWAGSQGFWFFVIAALFNGLMKITTISWDCLLVEDAPKDKITQIYSWVMIAGNMSALFAPIASILVAKLTLIPAVRILFINAFIVMTAKLIILYIFSTETAVGKVKIEASRNRSWVELLQNYKGAIRKIAASRGTKFAIIISILVEIVVMLGSTFWQIIVSRRIGVSDSLLPIFPMIKSLLSIVLFFTVINRINQTKLKKPLYGGFISCIVANLLLISITNVGVLEYTLLFLSICFDALGTSILNTLRESLVALHADPEERSGIMALLQMTVMLVSVPFGYIGGVLSDISRVLPFVLGIGLLLAGILATALFYRTQKNEELLLRR